MSASTPAPFDPERILAVLARHGVDSSAGRIDVIFEPAGCNGYADLRTGAERFEVHGAPLLVASLRDLVRMKEAADRPQDRQDVVILREMLRGDSDGSLGE